MILIHGCQIGTCHFFIPANLADVDYKGDERMRYQEDIFITARCTKTNMTEVLRGIKQEIMYDYRGYNKQPHIELVDIKNTGLQEFITHWSVGLSTDMYIVPSFVGNKNHL